MWGVPYCSYQWLLYFVIDMWVRRNHMLLCIVKVCWGGGRTPCAVLCMFCFSTIALFYIISVSGARPYARIYQSVKKILFFFTGNIFSWLMSSFESIFKILNFVVSYYNYNCIICIVTARDATSWDFQQYYITWCRFLTSCTIVKSLCVYTLMLQSGI